MSSTGQRSDQQDIGGMNSEQKIKGPQASNLGGNQSLGKQELDKDVNEKSSKVKGGMGS